MQAASWSVAVWDAVWLAKAPTQTSVVVEGPWLWRWSEVINNRDEDRWVIIIFNLTFYLNVLILENLEITSKKEEISAELSMLLYVLVYASACWNLAIYVFFSLYVSGRVYVHTFL